MAVSIDEVTAEVAPPGENLPARAASGSGAPLSAETLIRQQGEILEGLARRAERVRAD